MPKKSITQIRHKKHDTTLVQMHRHGLICIAKMADCQFLGDTPEQMGANYTRIRVCIVFAESLSEEYKAIHDLVILLTNTNIHLKQKNHGKN